MVFPEWLSQLGIAGLVAMVLAFFLKLIVDGRLHTDGEIEALDERIEDLVKQIGTLTTALTSSNDQAKAIISLLAALRSDDKGS